MPFGSDDDPFAPVIQRRKRFTLSDGSTSALADLADTELDPDPFAAAAARRQRQTPRPAMGALSSLITGDDAPEPLSLRERLFNVSVPEQVFGDDEDIRGFERGLGGYAETVNPTRERDRSTSRINVPFIGEVDPKTAAAESMQGFLGALRSAGSPVGLAQNATGRVGQAANALMGGEGLAQMWEGKTFGEKAMGGVNAALGALGALVGVESAQPKPRPVARPSAVPEGFTPRATSPLDDAFVDSLFAQNRELGLDSFDPATGKLRDDVPFDDLVGQGFPAEAVLRDRARPPRELSYPPAETGGDRSLGTQTAPVGEGGAPFQSPADSGLEAELADTAMRMRREGYPPDLIQRVLAEARRTAAPAPARPAPPPVRDPNFTGGLGDPELAGATPYRREPLPVQDAQLLADSEPVGTPREPGIAAASDVPPAPDTDPLEELLGPAFEPGPDDLNPEGLGGYAGPARYSGPERRGAGRLSDADYFADMARRRQTEIQTDMQRGRSVESPRGAPTGPEPANRVDQRRDVAAAGVELPPGDGNSPVRSEGGPAPAQDDVFARTLAAARELGFDGADDELRTLFADRSRSAQELIDDLADIAGEHSPTRLLGDIRQLGGLRPFDVDMGSGTPLRGDLASIVEGFAANSTRGQRGASSIFRKGGLALDDLLDQLHQGGRWANLQTTDDLVEELNRVARSKTDAELGYGVPGLESALEATGVKPGARWWLDEGDTSFDPNSFEVVDDVGPNASGESAASAEALSRQGGMAQRGERFVVYDRAGNARPLIGPDAVDYVARNGETYGVETPEGFRVLDDKGGTYQQALPGAESVRTAEVATPADEAPFSLSSEVSNMDAPVERSLFDAPAAGSIDDEIAQLLGGEQASPVPVQSPARTPMAAVPANVRDYVTKQLGYSPAQLETMSAPDIYRIGREKIRNPNPEPRAARPATVKTRPEGQSYENLGSIEDDLEQFLEVEAPRRSAQAAERTARAQERVGIPANRVNQPGARSIAPGVRQPAPDAPVQGVREPAAGESVSERQSRVASMQGDQRRAGKALDQAFDAGDYKGFSQQLGDAVERFWNRQTKMGSGDPGVRRGDTGTILEGGIVPGFSMANKVIADPKKYAALAKEMLANPGVRALVGGTLGYETDDDEPLRGALYGAILAAGAPSGAKALARTFQRVRAGKSPRVIVDPKSKDLSMWRLVYGQSLERSVPDVFREVNEIERDLQQYYREQGIGTKERVAADKIAKGEVAGVLDRAADEARRAGLKRKAWYLDASSRRVRGRRTVGEQGIKKITDTVFGEGSFDPTDVERHTRAITYRTLIGYAADSALQNLSQPVLAMLHVSPGDLAAGYRHVRSTAGKALGENVKLFKPTDTNESLLGQAQELAGAGKPSPENQTGLRGVVSDPGRLLRMSDNVNRRVVYMAALNRRGVLEDALRTGKVPEEADKWAQSVVRKTQGHTGPLGNNPFHKGPLSGSLSSFQKYPGLFIENMVDAFNDPEARGKALVMSMLGLAAAGRFMGISLEDMLVSGGRPLGIDLAHPGESLQNVGRLTPVGRAITDVGAHLRGEANHPFAALPGRGFLKSDAATLALGRYPVKVAQKGGEILEEGLGLHAPESVSDTRAPHTGLDDLANLVGLKTTSQVEGQRSRREASRFLRREQQQRREQKSSARDDLERALRSGDAGGRAEAESRMSPADRKAFYRRRGQTPFERLRQQVPRDARDRFDEEFKRDLDRR